MHRLERENKELEKRMIKEIMQIVTTDWRKEPEGLEFVLNQLEADQLRALSGCLIQIKQDLEDALKEHLDKKVVK